MTLEVRPPLPPMEALSVDIIPEGEQCQYEPKSDGFRCIAFRGGTNIELQSKASQPLARYFPEIGRAKLPRWGPDKSPAQYCFCSLA